MFLLQYLAFCSQRRVHNSSSWSAVYYFSSCFWFYCGIKENNLLLSLVEAAYTCTTYFTSQLTAYTTLH